MEYDSKSVCSISNRDLCRKKGLIFEQGVTSLLRELKLNFLIEKEIRETYGKSFNGIDHLIISEDKIILIQEKWRDTNSQKCASQFKENGRRLLNFSDFKDKKIIFVWLSKIELKGNSAATLLDTNCINFFSKIERVSEVFFQFYVFLIENKIIMNDNITEILSLFIKIESEIESIERDGSLKVKELVRLVQRDPPHPEKITKKKKLASNSKEGDYSKMELILRKHGVTIKEISYKNVINPLDLISNPNTLIEKNIIPKFQNLEEKLRTSISKKIKIYDEYIGITSIMNMEFYKKLRSNIILSNFDLEILEEIITKIYLIDVNLDEKLSSHQKIEICFCFVVMALFGLSSTIDKSIFTKPIKSFDRDLDKIISSNKYFCKIKSKMDDNEKNILYRFLVKFDTLDNFTIQKLLEILNGTIFDTKEENLFELWYNIYY